MIEWLKEEYRKEGLVVKVVTSLEICKLSAFPIQKSSSTFCCCHFSRISLEK